MKPNRAIRRFDVFAEYQRLKGLKENMTQDAAKGYGIWLAKGVASRKFSKSRGKERELTKEGKKQEEPQEELVDNKWRTLDGVAQTDELFEREVVQRMGRDFYEKVFAPAIEAAFESGKDYTEIRDSVRENWRP
jgi:hypothetical protein